MNDRPRCHAPLFTFRRLREKRRIDALLYQVILDGEDHAALEAGGRQDVARMPGILEPLHDRAQAVRDASRGVADAVVIDEKKPHNNSEYERRNGESTTTRNRPKEYRKMFQESHQTKLQEQTQQLLQGPLKHVRRAALAAALLPLASVAATPAAAQSAMCASGGICGFVWDDTNNNGVQDAGEPGIEGAVVSLDSMVTATDADGFYSFGVGPGSYSLAVQIPPGTQPSPPDIGGDDTLDSDGRAD